MWVQLHACRSDPSAFIAHKTTHFSHNCGHSSQVTAASCNCMRRVSHTPHSNHMRHSSHMGHNSHTRHSSCVSHIRHSSRSRHVKHMRHFSRMRHNSQMRHTAVTHGNQIRRHAGHLLPHAGQDMCSGHVRPSCLLFVTLVVILLLAATIELRKCSRCHVWQLCSIPGKHRPV